MRREKKNVYSTKDKFSFFIVHSCSLGRVRESSVEIRDNKAAASMSPTKGRAVLLHGGKQVQTIVAI